MKSTQSYQKWSDAKFKKIFLMFLIASTIPTFLLISLTHPLEDKYQTLMQSKQVYILNESGQKFLVSAQDTREKTFQIFGSLILKKMFTFTFDEDSSNIDFFKQYSSITVFDKMMRDTDSLRIEVEEVSGGYKPIIKKYYVYRDGDRYVMEVFFDHELTSKAVSSSTKYMMRMYLASGSNDSENFSGVFLDDYEIFAGDDMESEQQDITESME